MFEGAVVQVDGDRDISRMVGLSVPAETGQCGPGQHASLADRVTEIARTLRPTGQAAAAVCLRRTDVAGGPT
jgi:hypothetical protein